MENTKPLKPKHSKGFGGFLFLRAWIGAHLAASAMHCSFGGCVLYSSLAFVARMRASGAAP
jgi:hypothetical protein